MLAGDNRRNYLPSEILGIVVYVVVLLGWPLNHLVAEGFCLSIMMCFFHEALPYTGAAWSLIYIEDIFPEEWTPLVMLLVQVGVAILLQLSVVGMVMKATPASLLAKRMTFYSKHLVLYVLLAHSVPLTYFGLESMTSTRFTTDVYLWWLVGLVLVGAIVLLLAVLSQNGEVFGQFYEQPIDNYYSMLRVLRLLLLPMLLLIGEPATRLGLCLVAHISYFFLGFFRTTAWLVIGFDSLISLIFIALNAVLIAALPQFVLSSRASLFTLGEAARALVIASICVPLASSILHVIIDASQVLFDKEEDHRPNQF